MRRGLLLVLGFSGSLAAAVLLWISVGRCMCVVAIKTPCRVAQTPLVVLELRSYDRESIADRAVAGVAAVLLENTGDVLIEKGVVQLWQGGEALVFSFSMLPPGERILVPEQGGKPFVRQEVNGCWGWTVDGATDVRLQVTEVGRTTIAVQNTSGQLLAEAYAYYKDYDPYEDFFVGGATYCVKVRNLHPGHRVVIPAYGYMRGNSKLIQ